MYKNQLQELAQRSCFNLPSYSCIIEGPNHAPRFKASVNFNGEIFDSPNYCTTLRQAEHSAAEVAVNVLSTRGPSRSLTARVLDETGIYKNLLQETARRAGLKLPVYTIVRSGPGHVPTFTCSVELAGMNFNGEAAKTKKQAEKNAAIAAWSALKRISLVTNKEGESSGDQEQQEQAVVTRLLSNFRLSNKEDHSRQLRRRPDHQTQARRRTVRGAHNHSHSYRDNNASTSTNSLVQNLQHWRLIDDLLTDLVPRVSSNSQKQSSFASLLPPPPPRKESKILPPIVTLNKSNNSSYYNSSYNRPIPVQMRGSGRSQVVPPPLEDHQKDEEEWLGTKSDSLISKMPNTEKEGHSRSPSNYFSNPRSPVFGSSVAHIRQFPMSPNPVTAPTTSASASSSSSSLLGRRSMYTQGFNPYSHRVAPAVHIRSVIPVCAAPSVAVRPLVVTPSNPPPLPILPRMKETCSTSPSPGTSASTSSQPAAVAVLKLRE
ncbi:double-stranded RNA-binding protein 5 [Rosa rugosa]|uniref:double-stranded RNA-binding protein 5 n=1 Tax=Rosa rugosa TaxID=74645 RepID=UPI002B415929|nr:double-stranded RNA-binding protein 5 [Rosa rugosa]XP_062010400.1 double-stranded RNA-binding protein 5 [Rosa rugosa]